MNRIDEVRQAAANYGQRSVANVEVCRKCGRDIITAFNKYLTIEGDIAVGVPPHGEWNPIGGDYHDATFSFYGQGLLRLGDVQFGIGVRVDNLKDEGAFWRRIVVNLRREGEKIGVFVDDKNAGIWIPTEYQEGHVTEICDALYRVLLHSFREDAKIFAEGSARYGTIGFLGTLLYR